MSKVICDICGTAYPETASQCPICGSAKQIGSNVVSGAAAAAAAPTPKAPTKGGRFSNSNVRKRNKANQAAKRRSGAPQEHNGDEPKRSVVIVAWVLLIAVILVLAYIVVQFVVPMFNEGKSDTTTGAPNPEQTTAGAQLGETTPMESGVPCTDLVVTGGDILLDAPGRAWLLEVTAQPADTTDMITFASSNDAVATVDAQGRVTAVAEGKAIITITCGNISKECNVVCGAADETTAPETTAAPTADTTVAPSSEPSETTTPPEATEPPEETTPPTEANFGLFSGPYYDDDATLVAKGESFEFITRKGVSLSDITWKSDNPAIATVENGKVTAVAPGKTVIYGTYNGETDSCTIRCEFEGVSPEDTGDSSDDHPEWPHLYPAEDVSIRLDESFEISYVNEDGELPDIDWYSDNEGIASVSGDTVTGVGYGVTAVHGTYDGESISCVVRVLE